MWVGATPLDGRIPGHRPLSTRVLLADADSDGIADEQDLCPDTPAGTPVNAYGCPQTMVSCDYASASITLTSTGSTGNGTVRYVLADSTGTILQVNTTPTFGNLIGSHTYMALAINYDGLATRLTVGQPLSTVTASCYDWSDALALKVCVAAATSTDTDGDGVIDTKDLCPNTPAGTPVNVYGCPLNLASCDYSTPYFTLTTTGETGNGTVRYVLADSVGTILQVSAAASFSGLSGSHTYMIAAISYDGSATGLTIGQPLSGVTANCFDWSDAVAVRVCVATDSDGDGVTDEQDRCPGTPAGTVVNAYGCPLSLTTCDYNTPYVTLTSSGGTGGGSLRYVLTDSVGTILQISPVPSFSGLSGSHTYMALAISYDGPVVNLTTGQALSAVAASCYDWSDALVFKACVVPTGLCDYTIGSTIVLIAGSTTPAPGTITRYVLVDSSNTINQISATPSFSSAGMAAGTYLAYAITYVDDQSIVNLQPGRIWNSVSENCLASSAPVSLKLCVSCVSKCVPIVITLAQRRR
jgi:uncharacterized membrane protein YeiH